MQTPARQVPWLQAVPSGLAAAAGQVPVLGLQVAIVWHSSGVGQGSGFPPVQTPDMHMSVCVQPLVSSQAVPSVLAGFEHVPVDGLQVPAVWHESDAVQVTALPVQLPPLQASPVVQALPSSQVAVLLTCAQVPAPLQRSLVQTLLSLVQAVVAAAKQFPPASLHELLHSAPPARDRRRGRRRRRCRCRRRCRRRRRRRDRCCSCAGRCRCRCRCRPYKSCCRWCRRWQRR